MRNSIISTAGDLQGTLDINPNPNGILPLHLLVTLNTDPQSVMVQRAGQQKREGAVGGSVLASVENPSIRVDSSSKGELAELMDVGLKERQVSFRVQQHMYVGFSYGQAWHSKQGRCVSSTILSTPLKTPGTPSSQSDACGGGFREFRRLSWG